MLNTLSLGTKILIGFLIVVAMTTVTVTIALVGSERLPQEHAAAQAALVNTLVIGQIVTVLVGGLLAVFISRSIVIPTHDVLERLRSGADQLAMWHAQVSHPASDPVEDTAIATEALAVAAAEFRETADALAAIIGGPRAVGNRRHIEQEAAGPRPGPPADDVRVISPEEVVPLDEDDLEDD